MTFRGRVLVVVGRAPMAANWPLFQLLAAPERERWSRGGPLSCSALPRIMAALKT